MKELIAYYSYSGNSKKIASYINEYNQATIFEITTDRKYSTNFQECIEEAQKDFKEDLRPKVLNLPQDLDTYEKIYLVFPNWCDTMPKPVWSFLESFNTNKKTIVPVCSYGGSGNMGTSKKDIITLCPKAIVEDGIEILGSKVSESKDEIISKL